MRPMKVWGKGRIACVFWALGTALFLGGCQRGADAKPLKLTFLQESGCYENRLSWNFRRRKGTSIIRWMAPIRVIVIPGSPIRVQYP